MNEAEEKRDIVEKEFIGFPDIAADVINVLLYQGKALVDAVDLWMGPTETIYQTLRPEKGKLRNQMEDLCRYELVGGSARIMYLIANQTRVDSKMVLRKAGYTGGAYREQYEGKTRDIYPVIEFVLYWGIPRWKSSQDLLGLFRKRNRPEKLPDEVWKYIDDVKLHVYEMRHLTEETRKMFQSDMRIVVDYLAEGRSYRSDRKIAHKAALIRMIKVLSGDYDIDNVEEWLKERRIREEDEVTMCELFDQYERKGREEGIKDGREEGEARCLVTSVENAMQFFKVTLEKACEGLGTTVGRYEEAKKSCNEESARRNNLKKFASHADM